MARIEIRSVQEGVNSVWVEIGGMTDPEYQQMLSNLRSQIGEYVQPSTAVSKAFQYAVCLCPDANPSDIWQHVIYRGLLDLGWNEQRWKRVSGFALERALADIYQPRLGEIGIRMRTLTSTEAKPILRRLELLGEVKISKIDLFLEGRQGLQWSVFGAVHAKSSIAERIQDDVPASLAFMRKGLLSAVLTMDVKSYPPPHGNGINYGELGGRSIGVEKERPKREYIEVDGQFDALFSFNLRTPPSTEDTSSGKKIYTLSLTEEQPDALVTFLAEAWERHQSS